MLQMMLLAVSLSWDSFVFGLADGSLRISGASRFRLLILFAFWDGAGIGIGLWGGNHTASGLTLLSGTLSLVALVLLLLIIIQGSAGHYGHAIKRSVYLVPFMLCLDNVAAGAAAAHTGVAPTLSVIIVATTSGLLFLLGRISGERCRARTQGSPRLV